MQIAEDMFNVQFDSILLQQMPSPTSLHLESGEVNSNDLWNEANQSSRNNARSLNFQLGC